LAGDQLGDSLPQSLLDVLREAGGSPNPTSNIIDWNGMQAASRIELEPERRTFVSFSNTALYAPGAYLPAVAGILAGRAFHAKPLTLLYCARWFNVLICAASVAFSISRMRYARWPTLLIASFPMVVSQVSTVTGDAMLFATVFAWIAAVTSLAFDRDYTITASEVLLLVVVALLLSQMRPPYPILVFLVLIVAPSVAGGWRRWATLMVAVIAATAIPLIVWSIITARLFVPHNPEAVANPQVQFTWVVTHPWTFLQMVAKNKLAYATLYWRQAIGWLEWLNVPLPRWLSNTYRVLIPLSCCVASRTGRLFTPWQSLCGVAVCLLGIFATDLLVYMAWNGVADAQIQGIQGRYYIPFLLVLSVAMSNRLLPRQSVRLPVIAACLGFAIAANATALLALARAGHLL
jgi:uncharacterized membrane protein